MHCTGQSANFYPQSRWPPVLGFRFWLQMNSRGIIGHLRQSLQQILTATFHFQTGPLSRSMPGSDPAGPTPLPPLILWGAVVVASLGRHPIAHPPSLQGWKKLSSVVTQQAWCAGQNPAGLFIFRMIFIVPPQSIFFQSFPWISKENTLCSLHPIPKLCREFSNFCNTSSSKK